MQTLAQHTIRSTTSKRYADLSKSLAFDWDVAYGRARLMDSGDYQVEGYHRHHGSYVGTWDAFHGTCIAIVTHYPNGYDDNPVMTAVTVGHCFDLETLHSHIVDPFDLDA